MKKLNDFQKLMLNKINCWVLEVGWLICILFGLNYIKQLAIFVSPEYHYWLTIMWGVALIVLGLLFLIRSKKYKKRIKELLDDRKV